MAGTNESPNIVAGSLRRAWRNAGSPVDGVNGTYAAIAEKGDLLIDTTNAKLYQNTNTQASPAWTERIGVTLVASSKVNPASGVAGFAVVSTALTLGSAGSIVAPFADMGNAANDAARDALAGNVDGAVAIDSVGVAGVFKVWCRVGGAWKSATIA